MTRPNVVMNVRKPTPEISIIDIQGEINAFAESPLMNAYAQATADGAMNILLNFTNLEYMNSSGIGLLVTLLVRASRQKQRLVAYGLNDHYRQIFELTRLNEVITVAEDESSALSVLGEAAKGQK